MPYAQDFKELGAQVVTPLTSREFYQAAKELGLPAGIVVGLLASLGAGVKVYDRK